jgi:hypothetical protein
MELKGCCSECSFASTGKVNAALEQPCHTAAEMLYPREDAAVTVTGIEKLEFAALLFF